MARAAQSTANARSSLPDMVAWSRHAQKARVHMAEELTHAESPKKQLEIVATHTLAEHVVTRVHAA